MLADWRTAPVRDGIRTVLGFLEKLTLHPQDVTSDDLTVMRDAGVSDAAIEDAIAVCTVFNIIDRVADALGFDIPPREAFDAMAPMMLAGGYRFA